jgi:hypothetical protein
VFIATDRPVEAAVPPSPPWREVPDPSQSGGGVAGPNRFLNSPSALAATLRRLRGLRLRLTLCRIDLPLGGNGALQVMAALDDRALILGVAPNGSFVALLIRPPSLDDRQASLAVVRRLRDALSQVPEGPSAASVRVAFVHRWADSLSDGFSFLTESSGAAGEPLVCWNQAEAPSPLIA